MGIRLKTIQGIWAALVLAALALGGVSSYLLHRESERIRGISDRLLLEQAAAIREGLHILFSEIESGLMDSLTAFPEENLSANLDQWAQNNPFVHTAFHWPEAGRLTAFPDARVAWTRNLEDLLGERLRALEGGVEVGAAAVGAPEAMQVRPDTAVDTGATGEGVSPFVVTRQRVREVTKEAYFEQRALDEWSRREIAPAAAEPLAMDTADSLAADRLGAATTRTRPPEGAHRLETAAARTGVPVREWGWAEFQGGPHLMGWIRPFPGAALRGFLVDRETLFQTLRASLPEPMGGEAPSLVRTQEEAAGMNSNGALVRALPESLYPGGLLVLPRSADDVFNRTFWLLAALLVGVLVVTFFFGASLLLWMARRTAVDAMQKTDFLSNVSHELKTPLTTLRMYAEMLEEGRVKPEARQRYLKTIHGETRRLARLVNNVLHYSALQKGKSRLQSQPLDVSALVSEVCGQMEIRAREAGMELRCELPEGPAMAEADSDALEQCLINLIDNACKYAEGGEEVVCRVSLHEGLVRLEVVDQGPGVPREQQRRIFEAFHRADDSLTARQPGSGLGLSITRSLVEQMGGVIRCEANRPQGARFVIELPGAGRAPVDHSRKKQ